MSKAPTVEELQALLAKAQEDNAKLTQEKAELEDANKEFAGANEALVNEKTALEGRVSEAEQKAKDAETAAAAAAAASLSTKKSKPAKDREVNVVSATPFSYLMEDGQRVSPDRPIKLTLREGSLLDANMKAGLIVEYEG